jgi:hypothetical protein
MRIVAGCLLVAVGSLFPPQSSQELHSLYGEPDLERYTARPGISVTVRYGPDHRFCQVLIEPPQSLIHHEDQTPLMPSEDVSDVLEEIVPLATRGKQSTSVTLPVLTEMCAPRSASSGTFAPSQKLPLR